MVSCQSLFIMSEVGRNIKEKHLALFIAFLIDIFKELCPEFFESKPVGRKRLYQLEELLGLNLWGDINNKESCRDKEKLCENNDESVNVLISGSPKKSKINDFINQERELIDAFDKFIVEFCLNCGLVDATEFVGDGTFLEAYANNFKALYPDEIKYTQKFLTENDKPEDYNILYDHYYNNTESTDEFKKIYRELKNNINIHGINLIIKALKNDSEYQKVMDKLDHMAENITKKSVKVSIIDPDAHNMKDKKNNWGFNYNYQVITDTKYGVIVDHYITKNPNDKKEVKKIVKRLINKFRHEGFVLGLDNGYWNIRLLMEIIQETCVEIAIPDKKSASKNKNKIIKDNKSNKRYEEYIKQKNNNKKQKTFIDIDEFDYIEEKDAYECPVMKYLLNFQKIVTDTNGIEYREYSTNKCRKCPNLKECTSQSKRKILRINEPEIIHINEYSQSKEGKETLSKRGSYCEGGFGTLFEARKFRGIKTRGEENADAELTRFTIIHNVLKIVFNVEINVLKKVLKYIKIEKKHRRATMDMLYELQGNFIFENGKIVDVLI